MIPREEIHIERMRFDPPRIILFIDSPAILAVVFGVIVYVSSIVCMSG